MITPCGDTDPVVTLTGTASNPYYLLLPPTVFTIAGVPAAPTVLVSQNPARTGG
jgi:hypothetical protein